MKLPFSQEQFFTVIERYNHAVWPMQLVLALLALACVAAVYAQHGWDRVVGWVLAGLWSWMALAYQLAFFTRINPAAWLFGAAFLAAAALLARHTWAGTLRFGAPAGTSQVLPLVIVGYGVVGYALMAAFLGQAYPRVPTFGLPCPTTIFTLGLLLFARRPVPASLFIVPVAWSLVGTSAAIQLGVAEDFALPVVAAISVLALALRTRAADAKRHDDARARLAQRGIRHHDHARCRRPHARAAGYLRAAVRACSR